MLTNTGPVAKFYLSIIDDVIESIRELFLDEGLEDRLVDDLRHLWESKMMQSKAMEDLRKGSTNPSNFVLQLPANYRQADQEVAASVVIPSGQNIHSFSRLKCNSETLTTFSLPAGLAYPVQIPAGVTLQTASGQLYKVNVPVVVTQTAAGQQPAAVKHANKTSVWNEAAAAAPLAAAPSYPTQRQEGEPSSVHAPAVTQPPNPVQASTSLASGQESALPGLPPVPPAEAPQLQTERSPRQQRAPGEIEPASQPATVNPNTNKMSDFQLGAEEPSAQAEQLKSSNIDDILKRVIEEEREKAERARAAAKAGGQSDDVLRLVYSYSELSDIVQLDGPADHTDSEEEEEEVGERVALEENDFLGMINAEAIKALQEGEVSSDSTSGSTSSDSADELTDLKEEDPLNSGDDVVEQDIPDLFDTDNVIVCQYDKIHRSKNRWKFHLKDGVMCYGGRDYVFSKAVGEAEW